jgi:hypothetical protein
MVRATETQRDRLRQADRDRASGRDSTGHSPHRNRAPPRSAPGPAPPTCPCPNAADSAPRSGRPGTTPTARTDLLAARSPGSVATEYYARDQIGEAHRSHETRCASNPGCFSQSRRERRRPVVNVSQSSSSGRALPVGPGRQPGVDGAPRGAASENRVRTSLADADRMPCQAPISDVGCVARAMLRRCPLSLAQCVVEAKGVSS